MYVSRDDPPFLIVHGDRDRTVPLEQSQILFDKLRLAGVDVTLLVVKNGKHGNGGPDVEPDQQQIRDAVFSSTMSTKTRIKSSRYDSPSWRQKPRIVCVSQDTAPKCTSSSSRVSAPTSLGTG